jgi:hypothetical protein
MRNKSSDRVNVQIYSSVRDEIEEGIPHGLRVAHYCRKSGREQPRSGEAADNVLQIRVTMASKEWVSKWQSTVLSALGATA